MSHSKCAYAKNYFSHSVSHLSLHHYIVMWPQCLQTFEFLQASVKIIWNVPMITKLPSPRLPKSAFILIGTPCTISSNTRAQILKTLLHSSTIIYIISFIIYIIISFETDNSHPLSPIWTKHFWHTTYCHRYLLMNKKHKNTTTFKKLHHFVLYRTANLQEI